MADTASEYRPYFVTFEFPFVPDQFYYFILSPSFKHSSQLVGFYFPSTPTPTPKYSLFQWIETDLLFTRRIEQYHWIMLEAYNKKSQIWKSAYKGLYFYRSNTVNHCLSFFTERVAYLIQLLPPLLHKMDYLMMFVGSEMKPTTALYEKLFILIFKLVW